MKADFLNTPDISFKATINGTKFDEPFSGEIKVQAKRLLDQVAEQAVYEKNFDPSVNIELLNPDSFALLTAVQLSQLSEAGESGLIFLARKLGLTGETILGK